jgi:hypothetical protein
MKKMFTMLCVLAGSGCAASTGVAREAGADVAPSDAGVDAPPPLDAPTVTDAPPRRDAPSPWDASTPGGSFVFVVTTSGGICFDAPWSTVTLFDDGRVHSIVRGGFLPREPPERTDRLAGGADAVRLAILELDATGIGDVPEGTYSVDPKECEAHEFWYRRGQRVLAWRVVPGSDDPPPPAALEAALRVAQAVSLRIE